MTLTFDQAMQLTRTVSSNAAFEDEECKAYFDVLMTLQVGDLVVEVGLEYGRSSSIALQVARERELRYVGIDIAPKMEWFDKLSKLAKSLGPRFRYLTEDSKDVNLAEPIAAILIDGDHSYAGVLADCNTFLPAVVAGGYAMFHDYKRESLPEVTGAVDDYMAMHTRWDHIECAGTLSIWQKVAQ
jgi:cephalosporin hydroxylase